MGFPLPPPPIGSWGCLQLGRAAESQGSFFALSHSLAVLLPNLPGGRRGIWFPLAGAGICPPPRSFAARRSRRGGACAALRPSCAFCALSLSLPTRRLAAGSPSPPSTWLSRGGNAILGPPAGRKDAALRQPAIVAATARRERAREGDSPARPPARAGEGAAAPRGANTLGRTKEPEEAEAWSRRGAMRAAGKRRRRRQQQQAPLRAR